MNIVCVLQYLRPGEEWSLDGDSYDGLEWISNTQKPTLQEIENAWSLAENAMINKETESSRKIAFQLEADPLFFGWQRGENTQQEWLDKVEEIRQRYPYVELSGGIQ